MFPALVFPGTPRLFFVIPAKHGASRDRGAAGLCKLNENSLDALARRPRISAPLRPG
jgi:hypothetical protein